MKRILEAVKEKLQGKPFLIRSHKWPTVRNHYLAKHNKCAACGNHTHLQVHHKKPFHLHPDKELDPTNFITLCEEKGDAGCHLKIGHLGNWKSFNPNVVKDAAAKLKSVTCKD